MEYILGVDGGATKTVFCISDINGRIISETVTGPTNYKTIGIKHTRDNIYEGIIKLLRLVDMKKKSFISACFGLSGMDSKHDLEIYRKIILNADIKGFFSPGRILFLNDTNIGLAAGSSSGNRIGLVCGTGTNCYGVNEEGEEAGANGWDYLLSDEGSGYSQGLRALKALVRDIDGRGPSTLLTKTIFEHLNIESISDLMVWTYEEFSKDKIASISRILEKTACMGDKVSKAILKEEAMELVKSVSAVARRINIATRQFDLVLIGSIFRNEEFFTNIMKSELKKEFPKIIIKPLTQRPVEGAIKLAREAVFLLKGKMQENNF